MRAAGEEEADILQGRGRGLAWVLKLWDVEGGEREDAAAGEQRRGDAHRVEVEALVGVHCDGFKVYSVFPAGD